MLACRRPGSWLTQCLSAAERVKNVASAMKAVGINKSGAPLPFHTSLADSFQSLCSDSAMSAKQLRKQLHAPCLSNCLTGRRALLRCRETSLQQCHAGNTVLRSVLAADLLVLCCCSQGWRVRHQLPGVDAGAASLQQELCVLW